MMKMTNRKLFLWGGLISSILLGSTYFIEYGLNFEPCPLCLLQRYMLGIVGILFWAGAIHNCKSAYRGVYPLSIFIASLIGTAIAIRHLWILNTPSIGIANCTAGLDKLFAYLSFFEVLKEILFNTSQECTRIDFTFLKVSLPAWSLTSFMLFNLFIGIIAWLQIKRRI